MNKSPFDFNSFLSEFSLPSSIAADLEILCQAMEKMFAGQPADMAVFAARLGHVMGWAKIRTPAEDSSDTAGWRARYAGIPKLGGTLTCQNDEQEWMLSMDSSNEAYLGSWRSLRPGEEDRGGLFSIEDSSSGRVLVLDTGQSKQQILLQGAEGLIWGSIDGFLQGMQVEQSQQPDAPESQPAPPPPPPVQTRPVSPPPPDIPNAELPPSIPPTVLSGLPVPQASPAPLPTRFSDKELMSSEQSVSINPEVWQCACGRKNAGRFCPKCGNEKPASAAVLNGAPKQSAFCRQCGTELSSDTRFCRICGTEVKG